MKTSSILLSTALLASIMLFTGCNNPNQVNAGNKVFLDVGGCALMVAPKIATTISSADTNTQKGIDVGQTVLSADTPESPCGKIASDIQAQIDAGKITVPSTTTTTSSTTTVK